MAESWQFERSTGTKEDSRSFTQYLQIENNFHIFYVRNKNLIL